MTNNLDNKLVVAISSRALFDLSESHYIFENDGVDAYRQHQLENEKNALEPGPAFNLVQKLLKLNHGRSDDNNLVEILLLSRNTADTGLRVFNSIKHHQLGITRAAFSGGNSPYHYAKAFASDLYLSLDPVDVQRALQAGCAAATIWPVVTKSDNSDTLNIAFDGDAVLFSDEAEKVFQESGLDAFNAAEIAAVAKPLDHGPFKGFLQALHVLQKQPNLEIPIRTALVTARSMPAHERVIHTLRAWDIRVDESLFLGGLSKAEFLSAFKADIFFDDQRKNCDHASGANVTSGHVPYGVANISK
jgi:5'-nucleotidase